MKGWYVFFVAVYWSGIFIWFFSPTIQCSRWLNQHHLPLFLHNFVWFQFKCGTQLLRLEMHFLTFWSRYRTISPSSNFGMNSNTDILFPIFRLQMTLQICQFGSLCLILVGLFVSLFSPDQFGALTFPFQWRFPSKHFGWPRSTTMLKDAIQQHMSLKWHSLFLMKEELGDEWTRPNLFRIGASSLLGDLERQIYHYVKGCYPTTHEFPMA